MEPASISYTLEAIQALIGGELAGNGRELIVGVNTLEQAGPGELAFAETARYAPQVESSRASAIIVPERFPAVAGKNLLSVANPRAAFVKVMMLFQARATTLSGRHPSAVISPEARLAPDVIVGECAVVRPRARIGQGTVIESGAHIGAGVSIGEQCVIGPNVILIGGAQIGNRVIIRGGSVIGDDGFGYVWADGRHVKIPQLGDVRIEDDVEIGSNVCVDRGMLGSTLIRRGTKIDNLVQIGHNDVIGEDVIITGQVGLSGSVTVGDRAMFAGQSGVVDHITIGHDARVGAASPVIKDVKPGERVWGFPARPEARVKRELGGLAQLPRLLKQLRELVARVGELESRLKR